ncbi:MAG: NCAIR mutase (PurE)-related protein [Gammaproteobacteria bacterium]|jgi:NCAIR mutase (PurE)-related protein
MSEYGYNPDLHRRARVGLDEAVLCGSKSGPQIEMILNDAHARDIRLLLTRLDAAQYQALPTELRARIDYDAASCTAYAGDLPTVSGEAKIAIVTGGTSDVGVAREALRTLQHHGHGAHEIHDVGVAGLWRLLDRVDELATYPIVIVAAGMDAALPSVIGGLIPGVIIAIPTSAGYGVAQGGETALRALLASCAQGITVVNIDNGFGAACAALRVLRQIKG